MIKLATAVAAALLAGGAAAQTPQPANQEGAGKAGATVGQDGKEMGDARESEAQRIARQPGRDIGIARKDIPALLVAARAEPYTLAGLRTCAQLKAAIADLDGVLGPDIDEQPTKTGINLGNAANDAIWGSIITFRGLLREATGAAGNDRRYLAATIAGYTRRGYLKGITQTRRCR